MNSGDYLRNSQRASINPLCTRDDTRARAAVNADVAEQQLASVRIVKLHGYAGRGVAVPASIDKLEAAGYLPSLVVVFDAACSLKDHQQQGLLKE